MLSDKITECINNIDYQKDYRKTAERIRLIINNISQEELKNYMYLEKMENEKSLKIKELIWIMNKDENLTYTITDKLAAEKESVFFSNTLYCQCIGFYNEIIRQGSEVLKKEFTHQIKYNYDGTINYKGKSDNNFFIEYIIRGGSNMNMASINLLYNNQDILSNDQKKRLYSGLLIKLHTHSDQRGLDYLFCDKDWFSRKPNNFYYENAKNGIEVFFEFMKDVKEKEANLCYKSLVKQLKRKEINNFINNEEISLIDYAFSIEKIPGITELKFMANYSESVSDKLENGILTNYPVILNSQNFNYKTYKKIFGVENILGDFESQDKLADTLLSYCDFATLQKSGSSHKSELVKNAKKIIESGDSLSVKLKIAFLLLNMDNVMIQNNYFRTSESLINYFKPQENIKIMAEEIIGSSLFSVVSRNKDQLLFLLFKDTVNTLYEKEILNDNIKENILVSKNMQRL